MKLVDENVSLSEKCAIRVRRIFKFSWVTMVMMIGVLVGGFIGVAVSVGWVTGITFLTFISQN